MTIKWGEMKPLFVEKEQTPSFPLEAFPPIIANYVQAVAEYTQTSPDMASVVALGVLATCNQRKFVVQDGHIEPLNLSQNLRNESQQCYSFYHRI